MENVKYFLFVNLTHFMLGLKSISKRTRIVARKHSWQQLKKYYAIDKCDICGKKKKIVSKGRCDACRKTEDTATRKFIDALLKHGFDEEARQWEQKL